MCDFQDGHQDWLRFVPVCRHLGRLFASNYDLACELRSRVGTAKLAFAQLPRPVLTNKHMPVKLRLQFFHSLISTKLFFGLGSWSTPTPKLLQYVQSAFVTMLRKVLRLGREHASAERVLSLAHTAEVRVHLATERLLYALRLFRTGPAFLHHLIHRESDCSALSWLHGLTADLQWMVDVKPGCDLTELFNVWQHPGKRWTNLVKQVWKMHICHHGWRSFSPRGHPSQSEAGLCGSNERLGRWRGEIFLLLWEEVPHQPWTAFPSAEVTSTFSLEHQFLQGCACLHCGKFLWTSVDHPKAPTTSRLHTQIPGL